MKEGVRFEALTAVTMKNGVFWVVTPCGSCKNPEDTILHEGGCFTVEFDGFSGIFFLFIL
jgi:hypothetical protein